MIVLKTCAVMVSSFRRQQFNGFAFRRFQGDDSLFGIGREVRDDQIHQTANAAAFDGGAGEYRNDFTAAYANTNALGQFRVGKFFAREEFFHQIVVAHGNCFSDLVFVHGDFIGHFFRNRLSDGVGSFWSMMIPGFVFQNVDGTYVFAVFNNWHFKRDNGFSESFVQSCMKQSRRKCFLHRDG